MFNKPFRCEQSITVNKHISQVSPAVGDFNTWRIWSPWVCMETDCLFKVEGNPQELGHKQEWYGDRIGSGEMVMTHSSAEVYKYDLQLITPWRSNNTVEFHLEGRGGNTKVTWMMNGEMPLYLFPSKQAMKCAIESDYGRGLKMLKEYLETGSVPSETEISGEQSKQGFHYLGLRKSTSLDNMSTEMSRAFGKVLDWVNSSEIERPKGYVTFYHKYDIVKKRCDFTVAPVYTGKPANTKRLIVGEIPDHRVVQVVHTGLYDYLGNAWATVMAEQQCEKLKLNKKIPHYERYLNNPEDKEPEEIKTEVNIPVR